MDISIVVPLLNEAESLPELTEWIHRVMNAHQFDYEIVFVDDGSGDNSWEIMNRQFLASYRKSSTKISFCQRNQI